MDELVIEARSLRKVYRIWHRRERIEALRGIDLTVRRGEVFGFLGLNGAGKTTTVKLLLGLLRPDGGHIRLFGNPPGRPKTNRLIGYMPERSLLPSYLRLDEMLELFGGLSGLSRHDLRTAVNQALETVNLASVRRRTLDTFSKGMLQRASLAQALIADPQLLILDEPAIGLDPLGRKELRELIHRLHQAGKTLFINSHELEVVEQVCNRFAILHKGQILAEQPMTALLDDRYYIIALAKPADDPTALLTGLPQTARYQPEPPILTIECRTVADLNDAIDALRQRGALISTVNPVTMTLEDLFIRFIKDGAGEGQLRSQAMAAPATVH